MVDSGSFIIKFRRLKNILNAGLSTMRRFSVLIFSLLLGATTLGGNSSHAQDVNAKDKVRYVRDWMTIPLRETADPDSTIIHKGVVSGAPLVLLQADDK
ncbi:MAG: hypothetical protein ABW049_10560, partial [Spongiibacteraceae bacterium]